MAILLNGPEVIKTFCDERLTWALDGSKRGSVGGWVLRRCHSAINSGRVMLSVGASLGLDLEGL